MPGSTPLSDAATIEALRAEVAELKSQVAGLSAELLTPQVFMRLSEWLSAPSPKEARHAFTAGIERQIAYALEMDVLPVIRQKNIRLANAEREIQQLKRGEYICPRCGVRQTHPSDTSPPFPAF